MRLPAERCRHSVQGTGVTRIWTVCNHPQNVLRKSQNRNADNIIAAGKVSTQAIAILRTVSHCRPDWFAAIVPAMPEESTCVVLTGSPNQSAAPIVAIAVISAAAPWA